MRTLLTIVAAVTLPAMTTAQECKNGLYYRTTDHYSFIASSAEGAIGDVVAIDISLMIYEPIEGRVLYAVGISPCFEDALLEFTGDIHYSPEFDRLAWSSRLWTSEISPARKEYQGHSGFILGANLRKDFAASLFSVPEPVHLITAFFRVKGAVGDSAEISFSDNVLRHADGEGCIVNHLAYQGRTASQQIYAQSTRHVSGIVKVLDGPPTQTEIPSLPPNAKVYPEAPTAESARIHFELSGAAVQPGAEDVPISVHVTSEQEFSGYALSITFPKDLAEVTAVDEHVRPGVVRIDNDAGTVGVVMTNSRRRTGAEGERVHLVTLHVALKEGAVPGSEVPFAFEDRAPFINWLAIHYQDTINAEPLSYTAEVGPLDVAGALLKVQGEATAGGDVNLDFLLDLTDAVAVLDSLFLGRDKVLCPEAADFNGDGSVNISDPVALLGHLFLGGPGPASKEILCNRR